MACRRSLFGVGWALAVSWGLCGPAMAETAIALPEVVVPASEDAPETVSAPKTDMSSVKSSVRAQQFFGEAKDTSEVLSTTPGVIVQDRGGVGQAKTLSIRGAAPNGVTVLLDGVPLSQAGTNIDLSRMPQALVDSVEVLRGGAGARFGSGGLGGVINLRTKAFSKHPMLGAVMSGGSFSTYSAQVGGAHRLGEGEGLWWLHGQTSQGNFSYRVDDLPTLSGNEEKTAQRRNNDSQQGGVLVKLRRKWNHHTLDLLAEGLFDDRGLAGTVQNPTPKARQTSRRATGRAQWGLQHGMGESKVSLWARSEALRLQGGLFGTPGWQQDTGIGAEWTGVYSFKEDHVLSGEVQTSFETVRSATGPSPSWLRTGLWVADEWWPVSSLSVVPSLRLDLAGPFVAWSPKGGVVWKLSKNMELFSNVGQAVRLPSFLELYVRQGQLLPNEALKPEVSQFVDVAVRQKSKAATWQVGLFFASYLNLISYEYYPPMLARPYNFAKARAYGMESEVSWEIKTWLHMGGSYTFTQTENLIADARFFEKDLPYRPRHKLHARVGIGPRWLLGHGEVFYQSAQFMNRTQSLSLPARAFVNVGLKASLGKQSKFTASVEVKNLFNVQASDVDGYPLPSRGVFLTLAADKEWVPSSEKKP